MNYYLAPMEGLTGYIYRNAHYTYFNNIDKYFTPFILANVHASLKTRELNDILPENNLGLFLVPQLMTNKSKDFINTAKIIKLFGYDEINLNLGCPFGTVVSKSKGAGFLAKPNELDAFLYEIFSHEEIKISIKTRIGKNSPEEFHELIEIFNKYPIEELIIHPRIQTDFYKNKPNMDIFKEAILKSKNPLCYNGDIFILEDNNSFLTRYNVNSIMLGRGIIANPGLAKSIKRNINLDKHQLKEFHDKILADYSQILSGDKSILHKMKDIWVYMICIFSNNERYSKKIKKSIRIEDYKSVVSSLFKEQILIENYNYPKE